MNSLYRTDSDEITSDVDAASKDKSRRKKIILLKSTDQLSDYDAEESMVNTTLDHNLTQHDAETLRLFDSVSEYHQPSRMTEKSTSREVERLKKMIKAASVESLYSVTEASENEAANTHDDPSIQEIYSELQLIHNQLKEKMQFVQQKEADVLEREKKVAVAEARMYQFLEIEIDKTCKVHEEEHKAEVIKLEELIRGKAKENKRLKENFDSIKTANDGLRKQLEDLQVQHGKLEKQSCSLQARFTNLQRMNEYAGKPKDSDILAELQKKTSPVREKPSAPKVSKVVPVTYDVLSILLEWISDSTLSQMNNDHKTLTSNSNRIANENCIKVLPSLVEILRESTASANKIQLPSLQFIYWALVHLDKVQETQKDQKMSSIFTSTLRRLGEELFRPRYVRLSDNNDCDEKSPPRASIFSPRPEPLKLPKEGLFYKSPHLHIRFLSSLIILKTLTQADHVAQVFESLRHDLRTEAGKQLFMHYKATCVLLCYFRPNNKVLLGYALDVLLQMAMESHTTPLFLDGCSNESWFRGCALIMRTPNIDEKIIEKLSVLLQKLSKIKNNRRMFDLYGITTSIHDVLRSYDTEHTFLALNLKSTLLNLGCRSSV